MSFLLYFYVMLMFHHKNRVLRGIRQFDYRPAITGSFNPSADYYNLVIICLPYGVNWLLTTNNSSSKEGGRHAGGCS